MFQERHWIVTWGVRVKVEQRSIENDFRRFLGGSVNTISLRQTCRFNNYGLQKGELGEGSSSRIHVGLVAYLISWYTTFISNIPHPFSYPTER